MSLYNAKTEDSSLRISKFDEDLNVESSYLTSPSECTCPAGHRSTCRHREMYPILLTLANLPQFWDYERERVVAFANEDETNEPA